MRVYACRCLWRRGGGCTRRDMRDTWDEEGSAWRGVKMQVGSRQSGGGRAGEMGGEAR